MKVSIEIGDGLISDIGSGAGEQNTGGVMTGVGDGVGFRGDGLISDMAGVCIITGVWISVRGVDRADRPLLNL